MKVKKILSVIICLAILLSISCLTAFADDVLTATPATELPEAVDGVITLTSDVIINDTFNVTENLTIEGNDYTLTYTGTGRAIDVRKETNGANLTLNNLTVDCTANYCQRGVNYNTSGTLVLNDVTVKGTNVTYAVNLPADSDNCTVTITNSDISGNIALNVWGENATINVADTDLTSIDNVAAENYSAVKLNNDGTTVAEGTVITITGGSITALDEKGEPSVATSNATLTGSINVSDTTVVTGSNVEVVAIVAYNGYSEFYSYSVLQNAIDKATDDANATVKLLKDIEVSDMLTVTGEIVLDLNGKTISQTKAQTAGYQMILNDGKLTINDSVGGGKISYTDSGNGGEYISDTIYNRGTLVINGGTIENISSATVATNGYPHAVDTYSGIRDTSVTINGGTIYCAEYSAIRMFCVSATNKADLVINGGTIKGAVDMQNGTKNAALGSLTVNGGTFETTKNANNIRFANWNGGATEYGITAQINDGTFNGGITTAYVPATANWDSKIITGGTFSFDVADYVADGFKMKYNGDGTYVVVDPIWTTEYAVSGNTIRFIFDANIDGEVISGIKFVKVTGTEAEYEAAAGLGGETTNSKTFYGDVTDVPEDATFYAVAFVKSGDKTYWSAPVMGKLAQ